MAVATMHQQAGPQYPAIKLSMMGMYIFLASEVMFFGSLFATYFYLYGSHIVWPPPAPSSTPEFYVNWWPIPFFNTIVLLSSGVTCHFASAFFIMTGFHGLHVLGGLILLLIILYRAARGQFSPRNHVGVAAVTLYWHFVDVVWIFLFGILYLGVTLFR